MATIYEYFEQAQLSMAAYALELDAEMSNLEYRAALAEKGMSAKQAEDFAASYAIVDQYTDPTGFSGTIFEKDGISYFAIRGTEEPFTTAGNLDWAGTNLSEIGREGVAVNQGLAMFNWLQRLYGESGKLVQQYRYENGVIDTFTDTATGELNGQTSPISVVGHSLGGHLAMMLGRMAPNIFSNVYTYNAPGFDTGIWKELFGEPSPPSVTSEGFFGLLQDAATSLETGDIGTAWNNLAFSHLDVDGDVVSKIGDRPGDQKTMFSETASNAIGAAGAAHGVVELTDALAVYSLLSEFNQNTSFDEITPVLQAASNEAEKSLESIVNALIDLFGLGGQVATDDRDALYQRIDDLSAFRDLNFPEAQWVSLVGFVPDTLAAAAPGALGFIYALEQLNPFAMVNVDSLYTDLNPGDYSDMYLLDRATLLEDKLIRAVNDYPNDGVGNEFNSRGFYAGKFLHLIDDETGLDTRKVNGALADLEITLHFGKDDNAVGDSLVGAIGKDHLYGRAGDDILEGKKGEDYLEGGAGNDEYIFSLGDGADSIFDSDGIGSISIRSAAGTIPLGGTIDSLPMMVK